MEKKTMNNETIEVFDEIVQEVKDSIADGAITNIISNGCPYEIIALNNLIHATKYSVGCSTKGELIIAGDED